MDKDKLSSMQTIPQLPVVSVPTREEIVEMKRKKKVTSAQYTHNYSDMVDSERRYKILPQVLFKFFLERSLCKTHKSEMS